jgi:eukaryotic-like serine/threonine-protein kinase
MPEPTHALANPLVAGEFGAQFCLGIPLRNRAGFNLGALCVLDFKPREVTARDLGSHQSCCTCDE